MPSDFLDEGTTIRRGGKTGHVDFLEAVFLGQIGRDIDFAVELDVVEIRHSHV